MKSTILSLAAVAVVMAFTGCKKTKTEDPNFSVGNISLAGIPAAGLSETIKITSNIAWEITGTTGWCKVEPSSGAGNETVAVTITPNEDADPRDTKLTISATGYTPVDINVTQLADNVLNGIKDAKLREWIQANLMAQGQVRLTAAQAAAVPTMYIKAPASSEISSLEGVDSFPNLRQLGFEGDKENPKPIETTGILSLKNLTDLSITYTQIEEINIKDLPQLISLNCSVNPALTSFTVENTPKLQALYINDTPITSLSLADMPELATLYYNSTPSLANVYMENIGLESFSCNGRTAIESVTLKNMANVTTINCSSNYNMTEFTCVDVPKLTGLDLGYTSAVTDLHVEKLGLVKFDYYGYTVVESITVKDMPDLTEIRVYGPINTDTALKTVVIEGNPKLTLINCSRNPGLEVITLTGSPNIETYFCNNTKFGPELDMSGYLKLKDFIGTFTELTKIYVWWQPMTSPAQLERFSMPENCEAVYKAAQ